MFETTGGISIHAVQDARDLELQMQHKYAEIVQSTTRSIHVSQQPIPNQSIVWINEQEALETIKYWND